jgi:hypothetical protein
MWFILSLHFFADVAASLCRPYRLECRAGKAASDASIFHSSTLSFLIHVYEPRKCRKARAQARFMRIRHKAV